MTKIVTTIINLNKVLGCVDNNIQQSLQYISQKSPTPQCTAIVLVKKPTLEEIEKQKRDKLQNYLKFAELVNGRSSLAGRIITPIVYASTGHDFISQIKEYSIETTLTFLGVVFIITLLSRLSYDKYKENNNDSLFYSFEDYSLKFFMIDWVVILTIIAYSQLIML
jgi:hypothetical protein